ncbi:hypothetical protein JYU34_014304 [Plutella xylostella]|uniref:Uncharacterized protein n=1 Tax=Plutella xylostella TaxID=51655 RepID=A0ABQ7Q840_PLUXY|nr:hypothetical protein JYU34_014304 [Plutella xylostella]
MKWNRRTRKPTLKRTPRMMTRRLGRKRKTHKWRKELMIMLRRTLINRRTRMLLHLSKPRSK